MGPPWARLPSRTPAGKAVGEMADAERADAPARRNRRERLEDEAAAGELRVGDRQPPRTEAAAAPQRNVEVEHARAPAAPSAAAEFALERLEAGEHVCRFSLALDQRHGIGEIA